MTSRRHDQPSWLTLAVGIMDPQANLSSEPIACNLTNVSVEAATRARCVVAEVGYRRPPTESGRSDVSIVIVVTLHASHVVTPRFCNQLARGLNAPDRMAAGYVDNEA